MRVIFSVFLLTGLAFAQLIPSTEQSDTVESSKINTNKIEDDSLLKNQGALPGYREADRDVYGTYAPDSQSGLANRIANGTVSLNDLHQYILYWINFLIQIAAGIAIVMMVVGAGQYMVSGISDNKEEGKKTFLYALLGCMIAFLALWIVDTVQVWITS